MQLAPVVIRSPLELGATHWTALRSHVIFRLLYAIRVTEYRCFMFTLVIGAGIPVEYGAEFTPGDVAPT